MPRQTANDRPQTPPPPPPLPDGVTFDVVSVGDLVPDGRNANRGTPHGMGLLENSIQRNKLGRSVLLDRNRKLIAGNKTAETFGAVGGERVVVVRTRGNVLIAHQREDLDLDTDLQARELAVADNRISEANLDWDAAVLEDYRDDGVDLAAAGISDEELAKLLDGDRPPGEDPAPAPPAVDVQHMIFITCRDEAHQAELLERFIAEGLNVKAQSL